MRVLAILLGLQSSSSLMPPSYRIPFHSSRAPSSNSRQLYRLQSTVDEEAASEPTTPYFMEVQELTADEAELKLPLPSFDPSTEHSSSDDESTSLLQSLVKKIGHIDYSSRLVSPHEYQSKVEPRLFSNIEYRTDNNNTVVIAAHSPKSVFSSASLLCGTALGSGLLFLPSAVADAGYIPSIPATLVAYGYSTVSALLTAELLLNRCGETGKVRNVGLLELYQVYLNNNIPGNNSNTRYSMGGLYVAATVGFVAMSYVVMGVYFGQGGDVLMAAADAVTGATSTSATATTTVLQSSAVARTIFASTIGLFLATASKFGQVQRVMTNILLPATLLAFIAAIIAMLPSADFKALLDYPNQHPELVLNAFPMLFMSYASHSVVPRVVYDLEGDESKIKAAIWGGTSTALVVYLLWNAVLLSNVLHGGESSLNTMSSHMNPMHLLQNTNNLPITIVSELAIITSLIGIILGFVNEFYDAIGALPSQSYGPKVDNKWQVALLTLTPSVVCSILLGYHQDLQRQIIDPITSAATITTTTTVLSNNNIQTIDPVQIMEYTGAFGASTLFLILPAFMVWQNRYGDDARPLTVKPMFPLGKITLGSLYKAAGTLIVEQGLEKLGVFEFLSEHVSFLSK